MWEFITFNNSDLKKNDQETNQVIVENFGGIGVVSVSSWRQFSPMELLGTMNLKISRVFHTNVLLAQTTLRYNSVAFSCSHWNKEQSQNGLKVNENKVLYWTTNLVR